MFVRSNRILFVLLSALSCASYCEAQFQWKFGCAQGTCASSTAPAYGMPPAGVHDVGGSWQWTASRNEQHRRAAGLYNQYCVRCHAVDGRGVWDVPDVPNFADPVWQSSRTDEQLARLTWEGRGAVMPAFRGTLTWDESWSLARYIRELAYQKPSQPRRNQSTQKPRVPTPATPSPLPPNSSSWLPVSPRPLMLQPANPAPLFPAPSGQVPLTNEPVASADVTPVETTVEAPIKTPVETQVETPVESKPILNPPEDSTLPSTELTPPVTDELLDEYFKEKPARPVGPSDQPVEELPAPRQSSSGMNLQTYDLSRLRSYDLSSPILGNPTQTVMESPSEIELQSYPATAASPWPPQSESLGSAIPPYPYSVPPGPLPAVKRDFSSPLYQTR